MKDDPPEKVWVSQKDVDAIFQGRGDIGDIQEAAENILRKVLHLAIQDERAACAKIADRKAASLRNDGAINAAREIAAEIRSRRE